MGTSSVRVSLQLGETHAERMLANIPVEFRGADDPQKWLSSPANVSVTIEGRPSLIEKFSSENTQVKAFVDMTNIFMAPVTLPVKTEIISGDAFRVTRIDPQNVTENTLITQ